jgi:DNA-binding NtrC family response regulator
MGQILSGKRIVVVEDQADVKASVEAALSDAGAIIVPSFDRKIDAAILDVRIGNGVTSVPVAIALEQRRVPFLFYTAFAGSVAVALKARWPDCKILPKPVAEDALVAALAQLLKLPKRETRDRTAASLLMSLIHHPRSDAGR